MIKIVRKILNLTPPKEAQKLMTLNQTVSVVREVARTNLRLAKTNSVRGELLEANNVLEQAKKQVETQVANYQDMIKVAQFQLSQVNPAHPHAAKQTENFNKQIEALTKELAEIQADGEKHLAQLSKEVADVTDKITAIESGEVKVCRESLQDEACRLLRVLGDKNLVDAITVAQATQSEF
jgi:chromosome segregation ATPase